MEILLKQEPDLFSKHLLEQQPFFQNDMPIINFIQKQSSSRQKKIAICAWNDRKNEEGRISQREITSSPKIISQKKRIADFLSIIRNNNKDFFHIRAHLPMKKQNSSLDNYDPEKSQIFLPLNNTIIAFPKSRSQSRKLQGEEKTILDKLYRKRQRSKIMPKEILINPSSFCGATQTKFPAKNYLAKNRSFIDERSPKNLFNPEKKQIANKMKKKFPNSYYKKVAGIFQFQGEKETLSHEKWKRFNLFENTNEEFLPKSSRKMTSMNVAEFENSPLHKIYKTIQTNAKFQSINLRKENDFSISKVRQDARNTHLNRIKVSARNDIQLLGATMARWKDEANKRLKPKESQQR